MRAVARGQISFYFCIKGVKKFSRLRRTPYLGRVYYTTVGNGECGAYFPKCNRKIQINADTKLKMQSIKFLKRFNFSGQKWQERKFVCLSAYSGAEQKRPSLKIEYFHQY